MYDFLKSGLVVLMCLMLVISVNGCGKGKGELELPEQETKQLERAAQKEEDTSVKSEATKPKENPLVKSKKFYVYAEKGYFKNNFIPSGWMGDFGDVNINDGYKTDPYSRRSCMRVSYTALRKQGAGWAGVYWQEPANNWGNVPGGFDLTGRKKLSFYAKGEKGGEVITEFKMGGIQGVYSDSTSMSIGPIVLTPDWQKYVIDLEGEDLSNVIGGFAFIISDMENPDGAIFYIDEIAYE